MIKYTSNEQYEKDRLKIIARHSILKNMDIDILDLLRQSKWIGADIPIINNQPVNQPCTLLKDVDTTMIPN